MRNYLLISILLSATATRATAGPSSDLPATPQTNSPLAIYNPDPNHLWNRLFATFYRQHLEVKFVGNTNNSFATNPPPKQLWIGPDVVDPPIFQNPNFIADQKEFSRCNAVLEEFLQQHGERLIRDPVKRAVFQRDLWAVFDIVQSDENMSWASRQKRRETMGRNLAQIMSSVALSRTEIEALPNTFRDALASGAFSPEPKRGEYNFLPGDFLDPEGGWIETATQTSIHRNFANARSVFRAFIKAPPGMNAEWRSTLEEISRLREKDPNLPHSRLKMEPGTRLLLLREMICIDTDGLMRPTHLVESVQMRGIERDGTNVMRYARELEFNRQLLFQHSQGGLKPIGRDELVGADYSTLGGVQGTKLLRLAPFPQTCGACHTTADPSLLSLNPSIARVPNEGGFLTITQKVNRADFIRLREWMAERK